MAAEFAVVVPFDVRGQLHAVVLLDGPVYAQAVRLPGGDRSGPCDQRGRLAVQGGAGLGRATGQQAEFTDRRADVGEGKLALAANDLLGDPLDAGHDRLFVVLQAGGFHQAGDEGALEGLVAPQMELQHIQEFEELGLIEPGVSGPAGARLSPL
ncbi:hypothetical protein [Streptomyces mirabilis]|uniref:hypothetical protein n=1 Tax=Streptomyces mirabilis TaxID=68239 RepID=UPI0033B97F7A